MHDEKCYELAKYFLDDTSANEKQIEELAQSIQDLCEDAYRQFEAGRAHRRRKTSGHR